MGGRGELAGKVRKTKVHGWRIRVSVDRRVDSDASPGAEGLEVIIVWEIPVRGSYTETLRRYRRESVCMCLCVRCTRCDSKWDESHLMQLKGRAET